MRRLEAREARLKPELDRVRFELMREREVPELLAADQSPVEVVVFDTTKEKAVEGYFCAEVGEAALARATDTRGRRARFEFEDAALRAGLTAEGRSLLKTLRTQFGRARVLAVYSERWAKGKPARHLQVVLRAEKVGMGCGFSAVVVVLFSVAVAWCYWLAH